MAWGSDTVGSIDTSSAAPGVDQAVITGTFRRQESSRPVRPLPMEMAQIQDDTAMLGALDALTIQNNAAREAYGYRVQAKQDILNASQTVQNGKTAAMGSILGGFGSAFGSFARAK